MPQSTPPQPQQMPYVGQPQYSQPVPGPQMLAPEPWHPQPTPPIQPYPGQSQPMPQPQFAQPIPQTLQNSMPVNMATQPAPAMPMPQSVPASQPQFAPPQPMPYSSAPAANNPVFQQPPQPQYQPQQQPQAFAEPPQPPPVQQFEMQIPHDDQPAQQVAVPQPTQSNAPAFAQPAVAPWQPGQPPAPAQQPPQYQSVGVPAIDQNQIQQPPVAPWQPQQEPLQQAANMSEPSPPTSEALAPQPPIARPSPESETEQAEDETPHHHELNIKPPESLTSTAAPARSPLMQDAQTDSPVPTAPISPSQWFQPPATVAPVQSVATAQPLFPSDTPLKSFSQQQEARNRRHSIVMAIILLIALVVLGGGAFLYTLLNNRKTNDPQAVFSSMLSKSLATKQLHQSVVEGKTGTDVQTDYDVSDVAKPRILATVRIGGENSTTVMKYFSTFQDTFVQYQNTAGGNEAYLNKWVKVRDKGVMQPNGEITLASSFEARSIFFGQMIFGNFTSSDKKSLESAFKDGIFSFDKSKVKTEVAGKNKTFVYEVKIDANKLVAYNQKVAKVVGVNASDINKQDLQSVTSAMLYIDAATQRLTKVITSDATILYSNYDNVAVQPEPSAQLSWSDFLSARGINAAPANSSTTTNTTDSSGTSTTTNTGSAAANSDASFDDPNFDDPLWSGDAGEN